MQPQNSPHKSHSQRSLLFQSLQQKSLHFSSLLFSSLQSVVSNNSRSLVVPLSHRERHHDFDRFLKSQFARYRTSSKAVVNMRDDMLSGDSKILSGASNFKALIQKSTRQCLASLPLNDDVRVRYEGSRRYQKLPQLQNLKLSVLKLDGSEFEVHIVKNATIAELKMAIEEVFGSSPKEGQDNVSWSLVWGHFCLCYEGKKLINDKAQIRNFGIKEGDQLQFMRHISIDYSPRFKTRPKKETINARERNSMSLPSNSNDCEETELINDNAWDASNGMDRENMFDKDRFKMAHLLRRLVSHSKLSKSRSCLSSESKTTRSTRFALQFFRL